MRETAILHAPDAAPPWEPWTPDPDGLAQLRRWRRPRKLWSTADLGGPGVSEARARRVLGALLDRPRHTVAVPTAHLGELVVRAFSTLGWRAFRDHGGPVLDGHRLPAHVLPVAVVTDVDDLAGAVVLLGALPATARGLLVRTPKITAERLAPHLSAPGGAGITHLLLEREMAAALPGWAGSLRASCAEAGTSMETIPGDVLDAPASHPEGDSGATPASGAPPGAQARRAA